MVKKINLNEDKNQSEVEPKKLKELGILKVLKVLISEDEETKYRCIKEDGTIEIVSTSKLLGKK